MALRYIIGTASTGSLTGVGPNTTLGQAGPVIETRLVQPGQMICLLSVEPETASITAAPRWQVSDDNSTWKQLTDPTGDLGSGWGTGTTGDDAAVERAIPCPLAAWGSRWVRPAIQVGGATGGTADLYSFTLKYRAADFPNGQF